MIRREEELRPIRRPARCPRNRGLKSVRETDCAERIEHDNLGAGAARKPNGRDSISIRGPSRLEPLLVERSGRDWDDGSSVRRDANEPCRARHILNCDDRPVTPRVRRADSRAARQLNLFFATLDVEVVEHSIRIQQLRLAENQIAVGER
jgi:hypothetical protein